MSKIRVQRVGKRVLVDFTDEAAAEDFANKLLTVVLQKQEAKQQIQQHGWAHHE